MEQFNLTCANPADIGLIGVAFILGIVLSMLIFSRLGDLYGVRIILLLTSFSMVPLFVALLVIKEFEWLLVLIFLVGFDFGGLSIMSMLFLQEIVPKHMRAYYLTVSGVWEGISMIIIVVYFVYISK